MTIVMGVLNVTPDSFSDGGTLRSTEEAVRHGQRLHREGASIIDVGGESTRPGATPVTEQEEIRRVIPVIEELVSGGIEVSIDTLHANTARRAVQSGATLINDVSGGLADAEMVAVAAATGARFVVGHWRGIPDLTHGRSAYVDVVSEVMAGLEERVSEAIRAGVREENIIVDPGLGFDKTEAQGWQLLASHTRLRSLGYPVLYGVSRKRMLGELLERIPGASTAPSDRDLVTAVTSALAAQEGAWGVRVHAVHETVQALAVAEAWRKGRG